MQVPKGDFGYYLDFVVKDSVAEIYPLTDYTITLKVWAASNPDETLVSGACEIVDAASGTCRYLLVSGDFDTPGRYKYELELTKTGAKESTVAYDLEVVESG